MDRIKMGYKTSTECEDRRVRTRILPGVRDGLSGVPDSIGLVLIHTNTLAMLKRSSAPINSVRCSKPGIERRGSAPTRNPP